MITYSQDVQDRAREWVNENYPDVDDPEGWDSLFILACEDLQEADDAADLDNWEMMVGSQS